MIGVYIIQNKFNDKVYLGGSLDIDSRLRAHFNDLRAGRHHNVYLQRAFDKYGVENFVFAKLFETTERTVNIIEQFLIELCQPQYNIRKSVDGRSTLSDHTRKEISRKMSLRRRGVPLSQEHRDHISQTMKGKVRSKEHQAKLTKAMTGKRLTEQHKRAISRAKTHGRVETKED